jgi:hypothetical protein
MLLWGAMELRFQRIIIVIAEKLDKISLINHVERCVVSVAFSGKVHKEWEREVL